MKTFKLGEPKHVLDDDDARLPGHYEIEVWSDDGALIRRFLTDKGRAAILRLLDEGTHEISEEQLSEHTVAPDLGALLDRMGQEAGEGA
jgi:hypothetical protein